MRKNLLKTLGSALLLSMVAWSATAAAPPGTVTYKKWYRFSGDLNALRNFAEFPNQPNEIRSLTAIEDPTVDNGDNENYGDLIQGYLVAPVSGNYKFYITSDDTSELYLSTDANPANKVKIANEPQWNGGRQYIAGDNQSSRGTPAVNISAPITLTAGQKYYIEVIHQEGTGGNNVSVAWDVPGEPATANGSLPIQGISTFTSFPGTFTNLYPYETTPSAVSRSYYANIGGGGVTDLTNRTNFVSYPYYPNEYTTLGKMEDTTPDNSAAANENFGVRLQTLLSPPVTGNYDFWMSADDGAAVYLSTDENPNNKVLIAREPQWNGSRQFIGASNGGGRTAGAEENRSTTLFPAGITLQAGKKYYLEALEKEGGGGNNLSVTWAKHGTTVSDGALPISTVSTVPGVPGGPFTNLFPLALTVKSASDSPVPNRVAVSFSVPVGDATAQNPANYAISGGLSVTGAALQNDKQSVVLTLSGPLVVGTTYTVTVTGVTDRLAGANPLTGSGKASFVARAVRNGFVRAEYYDGIGGTAVADLTGNPAFINGAPSSIAEMTSFNSTAGRADNYGVRLSGYVIPTATGNYSFEVNSDDASLVLMSPSADPASRTQMARIDGCCVNNDTVTVPLIAGRAYFIEAFMKEGGGGDNLDIRWNGGDIGAAYVNIDSAHIAYMATPPTIVQQPTNTTVLEGQSASFYVVAGGDPAFAYQWYTNGVIVPGATSATFTMNNLLARDNNTQVSVQVQNYTTGNPAGVGPYSVTSSNAVLHVLGDNIAPTVTSMTSGPLPNQIRVFFSEPVLSALVDPAHPTPVTAGNFMVATADDPSTPLPMTSVGPMPGNPSAALIQMPAPLTPGVQYLVTAQIIVDASPSHNALNPDPTTLPVTGIYYDPSTANGLLVERFENITVTTWLLANLTNNSKYPYYPDFRTVAPNFNIPQTSPNLENFGYRVRGYLTPSETANYQFRVGADDSAAFFLSTDADPAHKSVVAIAQGAGCAACSYANSASNIRLEAGKVYYVEAIMVEGGGGDWLNLQWKNNASVPGFVDVPQAVLSTFIDPSKINLNVTGLSDITTNDCTPLAYNLGITGGDASYLLSIQWTVDGFSIPGATNRTFKTDVLNTGDHQVQVDVGLVGKTVTTIGNITVAGDPVVPAVTKTKVDKSLKKIYLTFSKSLDATAADAANYSLTDAGNTPLSLSASYDDTKQMVTLTLDDANPLQLGQSYNLTIAGVQNQCASSVVNTNLVIVAPRYISGLVRVETYGNPGTQGGIGGNNVGNLVADPRYPNSPRDAGLIGGVDSRLFYPDDSHEAYGGRMSGYFVPPTTDNYIFYTKGDDGQRFTMNTNSVNMSDPAGIQILVDTGDACCQNWTDHPTPPVHLIAGQHYYFESLWKEGGGGDFCQVVYKTASSSDDPNALPIMSGHVISTIVDDEDLATLPGVPAALPTTGVLAPGSLANRGFRVHFVQSVTNVGASTADSERLLSCSGGANIAGSPSYPASIINYNINDGLAYGHLKPDAIFPGIPADPAQDINMAMEALSYVELQPGVYTFIVNSDDGFRVSPATSVTDPKNSITLGEFSGGRGSSDSYIRFRVTQAGLYPMRLIWGQGGGGGNLEFIAIGEGDVYTAINADNGVHAFQPSTAIVDIDPPIIASCPTNRTVAITNGCSGVIPDLLAQFVAGDCYSATTKSQNPAAGSTVTGAGPVVVTLTATDAANNSSSCQVTLTFVDKAPPVITACAPNTTVAADASCNGTLPNLTSQVTAADACGGLVTITQSPAPGTVVPAGGTVVTLTATDVAGNSSTCTTTVTVAPSGPAPAVTIQQSGSNMIISWTSSSPCWKLQATGSLSPTSWQTVNGHSPVTVPIDSGMKFFRLITAPNP